MCTRKNNIKPALQHHTMNFVKFHVPAHNTCFKCKLGWVSVFFITINHTNTKIKNIYWEKEQ